jgi:hypothetical protein
MSISLLRLAHRLVDVVNLHVSLLNLLDQLSFASIQLFFDLEQKPLNQSLFLLDQSVNEIPIEFYTNFTQ